MNQEIHNFNQELVKTINKSIFKEEITSIKKLEDIAFQKGYEEKDIREILNIFFKDGIIELPLQKIGENDFLVNTHKISELERENLL
ncbi:hypothetical protein [Staphylococcus pseudoxylosus]|uniref:hypothetical protein n=1 Tax=Staphylococcus pseudoxylosus TaxID=2282419 RepID=UPI00398A5646